MTSVRRPARVTAVVALLLGVAACTNGPGTTAAQPTHASPARSTSKPATKPPAVSPSAPATKPAKPSAPAASADRSPTGDAVTIAFGGDVHFEGVSRAALGGFGPISDVLGAADLAMVNLETAVTDGGTPQPKDYNFRAPASAFGALRDAGIDVATMANNHGMDFGIAGLQDSLAAAKAAKFPVVGIGIDDTAAFAPFRATINGQRIAIIGATQVLDSSFVVSWSAGAGKPGLASAKQVDKLAAAVTAARAAADTVIVFLHWGQERAACPTGVQRDLVPTLVAAGADVVVGSHAHVLLGGGWTTDGAYVDYGLGNFVFYTSGGLGAQTGVLLLTVRGRAVTDAHWLPAVISSGKPVPLSGSEAERAASTWDRLRSCAGLAGQPPS
ncbi:MAG: hypothetical protein JWM93_298 [Frankiales bacterium]|nr:hypothetical protein [Frankiales bacterium]